MVIAPPLLLTIELLPYAEGEISREKIELITDGEYWCYKYKENYSQTISRLSVLSKIGVDLKSTNPEESITGNISITSPIGKIELPITFKERIVSCIHNKTTEFDSIELPSDFEQPIHFSVDGKILASNEKYCKDQSESGSFHINIELEHACLADSDLKKNGDMFGEGNILLVQQFKPRYHLQAFMIRFTATIIIWASFIWITLTILQSIIKKIGMHNSNK